MCCVPKRLHQQQGYTDLQVLERAEALQVADARLADHREVPAHGLQVLQLVEVVDVARVVDNCVRRDLRPNSKDVQIMHSAMAQPTRPAGVHGSTPNSQAAASGQNYLQTMHSKREQQQIKLQSWQVRNVRAHLCELFDAWVPN